MEKYVPSRPIQPQTETHESPPEDELDALLQKVEEKKAKKKQDFGEDQLDAVDVFRARIRQIYQPVFDELSSKYSAKGIHMEMDAGEFLGGGSSLKMRFAYGDLTLELDGTVMRGGVAFYVIRGNGKGKGAVVSGPMLRIRNLSEDDFRQFVLDNLSTLIKDALRQA